MPLRIGATDRASVHMSLEAAERIVRAALGGGVVDGLRLLPEDIAARIAGNRRLDRPFSWQEIGEGEVAIITRPIFDAWRSVPSIDRATLAAVEPLVDTPVRIDDFVRVLEERLGKRSDDFRNELAKARKTMFERRWESIVGFGLFDERDAVVVLPRTDLVAVYAAKTDVYGMRSLVPLLRALE